jgi:LacI family transcriptional regulator
MRKRATIKDVAALAGVSLKTVSRVINREAGVTPEMASRVQKAVVQLDYRHNLAASNLRRGQRTSSIGVLLHDLRNPFSATLLRAIEDRARTRGLAVLSASLDDETEREALLAADLVSRRVDGLILMPTGPDQSYLVSDVLAGLAVVAVDRPVSGADLDTVLVDNVGGASAATQHLAAHGHERIALLTDRVSIWTAGQRRVGYEQGLVRSVVPLDPRYVVTDLQSTEQATAQVHRLLSLPEPPTAIFAARNILSIGAIRALRQRDLADRIALVGFDDFPTADLMTPPLTVIQQDVAALGEKAVDLLFARIDGQGAAPQEVLLGTTLVARGSGEIYPAILADSG